jgi:CRISPR-associated endonuclease Csn1
MKDVGSSFILGIDLGAASVGWALVRTESGSPAGIIRAGARVFEPAVDGDMEAGREESKGKKRREARSQRRQTWRRARRARRIFQLLQRGGLLPPGEASSPEARQNLLTDLDKTILASAWFRRKLAEKPGKENELEHVWPYLLRATALDEALEPYFLGRVLYHLAQRRGFKSNRKETGGTEEKEDEGKVKEGISKLRDAMTEAGARTLGEYFSTIRPSAERIRTRYTARSMYESEFDKIWNAQAGHHPAILTPQLRKEIRNAMFFQRKPWFPANLVGKCDLEREHNRAPAHLLISQRFRMLQTVNNLRLSVPGEIERDLTGEEHSSLLSALETRGDLTFPEVRTSLGLKKAEFNLERGGEKRILGNRTAVKLAHVFGGRWAGFSPEERDKAVHFVWSFEKPEKLAAAAAKKWTLDEKAAQELANLSLEQGYLSHSVKAMQKLLPLLEKGVPYGEARRRVYPERWDVAEPLDLLPSVAESQKLLGQIKNPAVIRALTELRKVVNAIIRRHGKPAEIRIELARDLRNTRKRRQAMADENRDNEKLRKEAAKKILDWDPSMQNPSRRDMQKVLLARECGWKCPYTGRPISMGALLGPEPQFDIEHIIPFAVSLDNSFANLTLCENEHNRNVKQKRTPFQAYSSDQATYQEILERVKTFSGKYAHKKLRRFQMNDEGLTELTSDFSERQLNDTRYATRLAADYLGLLYGGREDTDKKLRVRTTVGRITGFLRWEWKLNSILNDGDSSGGGEKSKSRNDHRHHAVDAIVTALTGTGTVAALSRAAERAPIERRRLFGSLEGPWPNFSDSVREEIGSIVVSHRVTRRVRGPLHEETLYSRPFVAKDDAKRSGKPAQKHRIRKPLSLLSPKDVRNIVDPAVRALVETRLIELGGEEPKTAFGNDSNLPFFATRDGRKVPIKRVRVEKAIPTMQFGQGRTIRYVKPESNHHVEILAEMDKSGKEIGWTAEVVSLAEATRRKREGLPIVRKDHGEGLEFKFSLAPGEVIEWNAKNGNRDLVVVRGATQESRGGLRIFFVGIADARIKKEMEKDYLREVPNTLWKRGARKVSVDPLGGLAESHE